MRSTHVSVRLSHGAWSRYCAEAEAHDLALGTYLRRRLEQQDQFLENELALRSRVAGAASSENASGTRCSAPVGLFVEILFILRQIVSPQKSAIAHSEVKRLGL